MQSYRRKCRKFRFVNSAPAERGMRTAAGVFVPDGRHLFLHRLSGVLEPRRRFTLSGRQPFSALAERGIRTAAGGFGPNGAAHGRLLFLHRLRGSHSPRSPYAAKTKKAPLTRCLSLLRICRPLSSSSCRNYRSRRRYYHHRYRRNRSRRCPDRSIPRSG